MQPADIDLWESFLAWKLDYYKDSSKDVWGKLEMMNSSYSDCILDSINNLNEMESKEWSDLLLPIIEDLKKYSSYAEAPDEYKNKTFVMSLFTTSLRYDDWGSILDKI